MNHQRSEFSPPVAVKQKSTKQRWVIATFPDSRDYSVIPTNWVLKTVDSDGNAVTKCMWPPRTVQVTSDIIKDSMEPSDDWNTYKIKLYENGKEYSDFGKAWYRQVALTEESASEVDQQLFNKKNKNKRLYCQSSMVLENSDTSSDEGIKIYTQKNPKTVKNEPNMSQTIVNTISEPQYTELNDVNLNQFPSSDEALFPSYNVSEARSSLCQQIEINQIPIKMNPVYNLNSIDCLDSTQPEVNQILKQNKIMELLNSIYKEQIQSRIKIDHLISKLEKIEKAVGVMNKISTEIPNFDSNFLTNWPMRNEQMFQNISKSLLDNSFVSLVEQFFMSIGGNSVKDNVKRILSKMFTNEFAKRCSWTGRGKDISTKLCDSQIVVVLKRCIKNSQKDYSDALFESVLADWFRYATTRYKRSLD